MKLKFWKHRNDEYEEEDELGQLWDYTAWELFRTSIKVFFWNIWQFLKPRRFYRRLQPLSKVEINELRSQVESSIKERAAKQLGGTPNNYVVREIKTSDLKWK